MDRRVVDLEDACLKLDQLLPLLKVLQLVDANDAGGRLDRRQTLRLEDRFQGEVPRLVSDVGCNGAFNTGARDERLTREIGKRVEDVANVRVLKSDRDSRHLADRRGLLAERALRLLALRGRLPLLRPARQRRDRCRSGRLWRTAPAGPRVECLARQVRERDSDLASLARQRVAGRCNQLHDDANHVVTELAGPHPHDTAAIDVLEVVTR